MTTIIDIDEEIQINTAIFDVPTSMYYIKPHAYEPKLVKIGAMQKPIYDTTMERYKSAITKRIINKRFNNNKKEFIKYLIENSDEIANMYDYPNFYQINQITADVAFIAWFIENDKCFKFIEHNNITIMLDLILMKNQVPLKLVMKILNKENTKKMFESIFISLSPFGYAKLSVNHADSIHFLECFYTSMISEDVFEKSLQCKKLFTASKLRSYGIKFKAIKDLLPDTPTFTSIQFDKHSRTLILPRIVMHHERTEIVLRNLLAYEMVYRSAKYVKEYVLFMDYLIDSVEDIQILVNANIIENKMGSDENAVQLWNMMCIGMTTEFRSELADIINELYNHCHQFKYRLIKESYDKFFSRPWLIISLITAIVITAATIIQTIFTVMSYYPH